RSVRSRFRLVSRAARRGKGIATMMLRMRWWCRQVSDRRLLRLAGDRQRRRRHLPVVVELLRTFAIEFVSVVVSVVAVVVVDVHPDRFVQAPLVQKVLLEIAND